MQPDDKPNTPSEVPQDTTATESTPQEAVSSQEQSYSDNDTRDMSARVTYASGFEDESTDTESSTNAEATVPLEEVKWQAKEYISPEKNTVWYTCLGLIVVATVILDLFYVHSYTLTALIIAIAIVLIVMSVRPARVIDYTLSDKGLHIGETLVDLNEYKAFGVMHDGKENSIFLIPIKRFRPGLLVYFPVESGESIVDNLGQRLPMQEIHMDFIDSLVRMLRL